MTRPDFFIVGAPRCGTTAMYEYLRDHPDVFMPEHKEPHYFGKDLRHRHGRLSEREYLDLFRGARSGQRAGEASTWYLYSRHAAQEIHEFNPNSRIVVMLRNPVDVMYSLHREMVFHRAERVTDFERALQLEDERRQSRSIPKGVRRIEALLYRDAVRFSEQLERYLAVFPRSQVKILFYEDLRADPRKVYREVLDFLGLHARFVPSFERVNESKLPRSGILQELVLRPPFPIDRLIPMLRRYPVLHRLRASLVAANSRPDERAPMSPELRRRLEADVAEEVVQLAAITGRDLSSWLGPEHEATTPALG